MRELHLFAGAGGGILGGMLLGHTTVCAVEIEPYCQQVLRARQRDGILPDFPIFGDIREFDGRPWRGKVDVVAGGFPCQDISVAGKGAGIDGERSGLWSEMARVISEIRPRFAFVENSPMLVSRGLARVLSDFAEMGYDARWGIVGAHHVGAPHKRDRIWVLAYTDQSGREKCNSASEPKEWRQPAGVSDSENVANTMQRGLQVTKSEPSEERSKGRTSIRTRTAGASWWESEPELGRVAHGVANRTNRLKAIGNGQVPVLAATAFRILSQGLI